MIKRILLLTLFYSIAPLVINNSYSDEVINVNNLDVAESVKIDNDSKTIIVDIDSISDSDIKRLSDKANDSNDPECDLAWKALIKLTKQQIEKDKQAQIDLIL